MSALVCKKQQCFESERDARKRRKEMVRKDGDRFRSLEPYFCGLCKCWHLGRPSREILELKKRLRAEGKDDFV